MFSTVFRKKKNTFTWPTGPTAMSVYFSSLTVATFPHQILNCFKIFLKTDARPF